jgi:hypothetical protein
VASCIVEAMRRRRDLGLNERGARRVVHARELRGERSRRSSASRSPRNCAPDARVDNASARPGGAGLARNVPSAAARALQVDRGDLPIRRRWTAIVESAMALTLEPPKRSSDFRARLLQCRYDDFTTMSVAIRQVLHAPFWRPSRGPGLHFERAGVMGCRIPAMLV